MAKKPPSDSPPSPDAPKPGDDGKEPSPKPRKEKPKDKPKKPKAAAKPIDPDMPPELAAAVAAGAGVIKLFDHKGDAAHPGTRAIIDAVDRICNGHFDDLLAQGADIVQVQSVATLLTRTLLDALYTSINDYLRAKVMQSMMGLQHGPAGMSPPAGLMAAIQSMMMHGMTQGGPFGGMPGGFTMVPMPGGGMAMIKVEQEGGGGQSIKVGETIVTADSTPKTGNELYAWAKINGLEGELSRLAKSTGVKGAPLGWSDEAVHDLHRRLVEQKSGTKPDHPFSDN